MSRFRMPDASPGSKVGMIAMIFGVMAIMYSLLPYYAEQGQMNGEVFAGGIVLLGLGIYSQLFW